MSTKDPHNSEVVCYGTRQLQPAQNADQLHCDCDLGCRRSMRWWRRAACSWDRPQAWKHADCAALCKYYLLAAQHGEGKERLDHPKSSLPHPKSSGWEKYSCLNLFSGRGPWCNSIPPHHVLLHIPNDRLAAKVFHIPCWQTSQHCGVFWTSPSGRAGWRLSTQKRIATWHS